MAADTAAAEGGTGIIANQRRVLDLSILEFCIFLLKQWMTNVRALVLFLEVENKAVPMLL